MAGRDRYRDDGWDDDQWEDTGRRSDRDRGYDTDRRGGRDARHSDDRRYRDDRRSSDDRRYERDRRYSDDRTSDEFDITKDGVILTVNGVAISDGISLAGYSDGTVVTVTYGGHSVDIRLQILPVSVEGTELQVVGISTVNMPTNSNTQSTTYVRALNPIQGDRYIGYVKGAAIDLSGAVVKLTFSDGIISSKIMSMMR